MEGLNIKQTKNLKNKIVNFCAVFMKAISTFKLDKQYFL
jgi:hypothetical protein